MIIQTSHFNACVYILLWLSSHGTFRLLRFKVPVSLCGWHFILWHCIQGILSDGNSLSIKRVIVWITFYPLTLYRESQYLLKESLYGWPFILQQCSYTDEILPFIALLQSAVLSLPAGLLVIALHARIHFRQVTLVWVSPCSAMVKSSKHNEEADCLLIWFFKISLYFINDVFGLSIILFLKLFNFIFPSRYLLACIRFGTLQLAIR